MERSESIRKITELHREMAHYRRRNALPHWVNLSLSAAQVKTLFCIVDHERISSKQLADIFEVTPANITGIIDKLIEQKLVQRVENTCDRRVIFLQPTQTGRNLVENLEQHAGEHTARILSVLSDEELNYMYLGLKAFLRALHCHEQGMASGQLSSENNCGKQ